MEVLALQRRLVGGELSWFLLGSKAVTALPLGGSWDWWFVNLGALARSELQS